MGFLAAALGARHLTADVPTGDYSANVTPPSRDVLPVDAMRALTLTAVYRAVAILAGLGSSMTLDSFRSGVKVNPAPSLVSQPDPWRPMSSWVERLIVCLALEGNAFLRKYRDASGLVVAAIVLDPGRVAIRRTSKGVKVFDVSNLDGTTETGLTDYDIEHVWGLEVPGQDRGLSPIAACRSTLAGVLDVRDYSQTWFNNSDVPTGVLASDQALTPAEIAQYRKVWKNPAAFDDAGNKVRELGPSVRVVGKGLTYNRVSLSPAEAQWLESQRYGVMDVARMFGIPGELLSAAVEGKSLVYTNPQMVFRQMIDTTLGPGYLRKIEAAVSAMLPRGQSARFDYAPLLRPDPLTQAQVDAVYLAQGVLAKDEVRARLGYEGPAPETPAPAPTAPAPLPEGNPA